MMMLSCENRGASLIAGRGPATKMPALAGARASRSHVLRGGEWLKVHGPAGWRNPYFPGGITPMEGRLRHMSRQRHSFSRKYDTNQPKERPPFGGLSN